MAGLLDDFSEFIKTPGGQGLLSAAFGGLAGAQRGAPLNSLGRAGLAGLSGYGGALDREKQAAEAAQMQKYRQAQIDNYQSEADARKAQQTALQNKQDILGKLWDSGSSGTPALNTDSFLPPEMRTGILPIAGVAPRPAGINTAMIPSAIRAGVSAKDLAELDGLRNLGKSEVARTIKGVGADGREYEYQIDKFGNKIGDGYGQYKAPIMQDLGGKVSALDPYTLQPRTSFDKTMTFSDRNAAARLSMERENQDKPAWNESLGGFVDPRKRIVMPAMDSTGKVIEGAGPKMTEDQAKASGWLAQAENAYKNMRAATKQNPDASKPGFNDALAAIPSMGLTTGIANTFRGDARQSYMQGASSMSEALLRAATGAGVNKDEALQKVRELTPQIGDSEAVIAQKEAAIPIYIESLKLRAGPGAKRVQSIMSNSGGTTGDFSGSDPLGLFRK